MQPTLLFDRDCTFCRRWIEYWRHFTGTAVEYLAAPDDLSAYPQVDATRLKDAVAFIDRAGEASYGAQAVFRALDQGQSGSFLWWCYRYVPGFRSSSEGLYRWVAKRRSSLAGVLNVFWPRVLQKRRYQIARRLFLGGLGLIYTIAFLSLGSQVLGLIGSQGILPAEPFLNYLRIHLSDPYWNLPTWFWIYLSDGALSWTCYVGAALGLVMAVGWGGRWVALLCWLLYLSLYGVGQVFLGFQWDILLLEAGFLAIFFAPVSPRPAAYKRTTASLGILWLYRWLMFRLMFQSGVVKLLSGDSSWRDLSALQYHYETQPLPNPISYYLHHLPEWFHRESALLMYGVELVLPFLIFFPQPIRSLVAIPFILFQVIILLTGNYGFFNLLAILLAVLFIADRYWPGFLKRRFYQDETKTLAKAPRFSWVVAGVVGLVMLLSWGPGTRRMDFIPAPPRFLVELQNKFRSWNLVNSYGLFAVMTKTRPEIIIEGTWDGVEWKPYVLPYKPGPKDRRPPILLGHMPRLDWQLWFAALNPPGRNPPWFKNLLARLLENSTPVTQLFSHNPFPDLPPQKVRANVANYYFSAPQVKAATGEWWVSGPEGAYSPVYENQD